MRQLHPPFEGPFKVVEGRELSFKLDVRDGPKWVSLSRLAFIKPGDVPKKAFANHQVGPITPLVGSRSGFLRQTHAFSVGGRVMWRHIGGKNH